MTIKLSVPAIEESTYIVSVSFIDTEKSAVVPKVASWSLFDEDRAVVNSREDVNIDPLAATVSIVLTGADLALPNIEKPTRYLLVKAQYDSVLYGNDLNLKEEFRFKITNLFGET